jgi:diguanylate cyclase (GGDEF)-like protein
MRRFVYATAGVFVTFSIALGSIFARRLESPALGYAILFVAIAASLAILGYAFGRREEELVETSLTDALTGVGNRRLFDVCLARELARAVDSAMPLAVLALDLDDLKGHNDRGGHASGDRALAMVGAVLRATCRSRDFPARLGGDEFAVIMPRSTAREAAVLGERVRADLRARAPGVTVSMGAADLELTGTREPAALLAAADRALYAAKTSGRDALVVLPDETPARAFVAATCDDPARCASRITTPFPCPADVTGANGAPEVRIAISARPPVESGARLAAASAAPPRAARR